MNKHISVSAALLLLLSGISPAQPGSRSISSEDYHLQNSLETRLIEYKDSDSDLELKIRQLEVVNSSRKKHRVAPLKLDILACRLANKICAEAALNNYVGHFNLAGEKPYHRYAFAGGVDHVSENASGQMTTGRFENSDKAIADRILEDHKSFMAEKKPDDGHKQTVINKYHNYVGLGFFADDQQFRYYELYIDRYYEFEDIPSEVGTGELFTLKCRPGDGWYFNLLIAYYEEEPRPMSAREISSRSYYNDFTNEIAFQLAPWDIEKYRTDSWYFMPLKFDKPGLYYIHIYSDDKPYRMGNRYSSEGKLQASGIVIRVN